MSGPASISILTLNQLHFLPHLVSIRSFLTTPHHPSDEKWRNRDPMKGRIVAYPWLDGLVDGKSCTVPCCTLFRKVGPSAVGGTFVKVEVIIDWPPRRFLPIAGKAK